MNFLNMFKLEIWPFGISTCVLLKGSSPLLQSGHYPFKKQGCSTVIQMPPWHLGYVVLLYHNMLYLNKRRSPEKEALHFLILPAVLQLSLLLFHFFTCTHHAYRGSARKLIPSTGKAQKMLNHAWTGCLYIWALGYSPLRKLGSTTHIRFSEMIKSNRCGSFPL